MSDFVVSWIRTVIPAAVGVILGILANAGIDVDAAALEGVIVSIAIGAWYAVARWLEENVSWLSWINGVRKTPSY